MLPAPHAFVRSLALGSLAAMLLVACAAEPLDEGPQGGSEPSVGGSGGAGGAIGGMGGAGGSLCAQDCSTVNPPKCHVSVCNDGSHPGAVGQCVVVAAEDGTGCDDGMFCTTEDSCQGGVCTGGPSNDCGMTPGACESVVCDETSKACGFEALDNGTPCTSDDLCITGAACSGGVCSGGTAKDCFFAPVPNDCHVPVCNPANGMCEPVPGNDGGPCSDTSDLCTVSKTCNGGQCEGGSPKDCSHLTQGCTMGVCEMATGQCGSIAVGEGNLCDDLDACTTGETCSQGTCGMGSPVTTCSQVADGCCPPNCTELDDYDCNCPGTFVNGVCVYLTSPSISYQKAQAQATCQALGAGWDLCAPSLLCDAQTLTYLGASGCDCAGGNNACNCSLSNVYVHVTGASNAPHYIRSALIPNCGATACTTSVSATCGVALCCKP